MTTRLRAEVALLSTTLVWGSTFVVAKIALRDISPLFLVAVRFSLASLFFLVFWKRVFPMPRAFVVQGVILGFFLFLGFGSQLVGQVYTTASKSAFITGMMVVFVPILQVVIEKRPPRYGNLLGILMVTGGLFLLTSPEGSSFNVGDGLTLFCAVSFALYIVYLDVASKNMTPLQLTFLQQVSTGLFAWIAVGLLEDVNFAPTYLGVSMILYLTIMATIVTTYVQTRYQKDTTPTRAVVIFSIEPVFAAVSAYLVLGENIGAPGIFGGTLIVGGVLLSELSDHIGGLNKSIPLELNDATGEHKNLS